jgi:hypothetical protein
MTEDEVEAVARALYESLENVRGWGREPERLKQQFRQDARVAIAAIDQHEAPAQAMIKPIRVSGPLEAFFSYLMEAQEISVLPVSSFRAVLRGPDHTYDAANHEYLKLVGHRELFDMPVRDALPELAGQGYYELLERVFTTKQTFVGEVLPIRLQPKQGGALEERYIDLVYRPIEGPRGETLGLFVEGCDRTQWARA